VLLLTKWIGSQIPNIASIYETNLPLRQAYVIYRVPARIRCTRAVSSDDETLLLPNKEGSPGS
jgi:hypothetical protein